MNNTPISSMAWVLGGSFIGSFGALFLKIGAGKLKSSLMSVITNWRLGLGIAFYLFSSVFFVLGVRKGELSVLYPMVSLGSVWTLFWSKLILGEPLTRPKFIALGMILCGIALLGVGTHRPAPAGPRQTTSVSKATGDSQPVSARSNMWSRSFRSPGGNR